MYLCNTQPVDDVNRQEEEAIKKESILHEDDMRNVDQQIPKELIVQLDTGSTPDISAGYHPLMVPMNHDLNNDIYFIGKQRKVVKYAKKWTDRHD